MFPRGWASSWEEVKFVNLELRLVKIDEQRERPREVYSSDDRAPWALCTKDGRAARAEKAEANRASV